MVIRLHERGRDRGVRRAGPTYIDLDQGTFDQYYPHMETVTDFPGCVWDSQSRLICNDVTSLLSHGVRADLFVYAIVRAPALRGIYKIECVPTGACYVGMSEDVARRLKTHCQKLRFGAEAFHDGGLESFRFTLLEVVERGNLEKVEQKWIDALQPKMNGRNQRREFIRGATPPPHLACKRCNSRRRKRGEVYCHTCRPMAIKEMRDAGYLLPAYASAKLTRARFADPDKSLPRRNMPWHE